MMKKFLIFIFAIFGLMVGVFALMVSSYYRAYENFHNHSSNSGSKVTYLHKNTLLQVLVRSMIIKNQIQIMNKILLQVHSMKIYQII